MFIAISSFFTGPFFVEYFKDMFLGLLVIAYCVVMVWTRPRRAVPLRDLPESQSGGQTSAGPQSQAARFAVDS